MAVKQVSVVDPMLTGEPLQGATYTGTHVAYLDVVEGVSVLRHGVILTSPESGLSGTLSASDAIAPVSPGFPPVNASLPGAYTQQIAGLEADEDGFVGVDIGFPYLPRKATFQKLTVTNGVSEKSFLIYANGQEVVNGNLANVWLSEDDGTTWTVASEDGVDFSTFGTTPASQQGFPVVVQQVNGKSVPAFLTDGETGDAFSDSKPFPVKVVVPDSEPEDPENAASLYPYTQFCDSSTSDGGDDVTVSIPPGASMILVEAHQGTPAADGGQAKLDFGTHQQNLKLNDGVLTLIAPNNSTFPATSFAVTPGEGESETVYGTIVGLYVVDVNEEEG